MITRYFPPVHLPPEEERLVQSCFRHFRDAAFANQGDGTEWGHVAIERHLEDPTVRGDIESRIVAWFQTIPNLQGNMQSHAEELRFYICCIIGTLAVDISTACRYEIGAPNLQNYIWNNPLVEQMIVAKMKYFRATIAPIPGVPANGDFVLANFNVIEIITAAARTAFESGHL